MKIKHDEINEKFFAVIDGKEAVLEYRLSKSKMDCYHTFVPDALRGKGIAAKLAQNAFEFALANNYRIVASCSYINSYAKRYDKYKAITIF